MVKRDGCENRKNYFDGTEVKSPGSFLMGNQQPRLE